MLVYIMQGVLLGVYAGVSPGPLQTLQFSLALKNGWRKTIFLSLTPLFSDFIILGLLMTIFSQLSESLLMVIRLIGGGFILYLAYSTCKSFSIGEIGEGDEETADLDDESKWKMLFKSAMLNWVNPNVYIFWGTIGSPLALEALSISVWHFMAFLVSFYVLLVVVLGLMIVFFSKSRLLSVKIQRRLGMGLAGLLFVMGGYNLVQGLRFFIG